MLHPLNRRPVGNPVRIPERLRLHAGSDYRRMAPVNQQGEVLVDDLLVPVGTLRYKSKVLVVRKPGTREFSIHEPNPDGTPGEILAKVTVPVLWDGTLPSRPAATAQSQALLARIRGGEDPLE